MIDLLKKYYNLCFTYQNLHWNVEGPHFIALHKLFEESYLAILKNIDEIAEFERMQDRKVMMFDYLPNNQDINNHLPTLNWQDMIREAVKAEQQAQSATMIYLEKTTFVYETDLLSRLLVEHEKRLWILKNLMRNG
ncbi:MAG: hypothetical protein CNLJKLNK_00145 [Holosporales bacterium]